MLPVAEEEEKNNKKRDKENMKIYREK